MANNPNAADNLIPPVKGEIRNPNGRPAGVPNRKSILQYILFDADIDEMGIIKNKPEWWGKVKPKSLYEVMTIAMGAKASSGDSNAYKALNKALGDRVEVEGNLNVALVEFIGEEDEPVE